MPRPRFENADQDKQDAILNAAAQEFAENGYEGASINRILASAGMSKGAFYYYFDDKADLAAEVLRWAFQDLVDLYDRMTPPKDPARFWDAIAEYTREGLAIIQRAPWSNELATRLSLASARDPALRERVMVVFARPVQQFTDLLEAGQKLGAIRDDIPAPILAGLLQSTKEAVIRSYLSEQRPPTPEEFEYVSLLQIDLFRRLTAPAQEAPR